MDALYGTVHTRLARDAVPLAAGEENVFVMVKIPLALETERRLSEERGNPGASANAGTWSAGMKELERSILGALVNSAPREPACSKLASLAASHPFTLAMEKPGDPAIRPLQ